VGRAVGDAGFADSMQGFGMPLDPDAYQKGTPVSKPRDDANDDYASEGPIRLPDVKLGWLDWMFDDTNIGQLALFVFCCWPFIIPFCVAGVLACKESKSRWIALVMLFVSGMFSVFCSPLVLDVVFWLVGARPQ
jgi:hypothetical protein